MSSYIIKKYYFSNCGVLYGYQHRETRLLEKEQHHKNAFGVFGITVTVSKPLRRTQPDTTALNPAICGSLFLLFFSVELQEKRNTLTNS